MTFWARHGVTSDELSTTVLVAGIVAAGSGALAATLRVWSAAEKAVVVTLAQLARHTGTARRPR